ncbi:MAG: hypothetical protein ACMUJM_19960 [bacterium]
MVKINKLIIMFILTLTFRLFIIPTVYTQPLTLFSNPSAIDPTSQLFGNFQYIPQFPIAPFLLGYPLNFVVDLNEVYNPINPSATGILSVLPIPIALLEQGWPLFVIMPIGATYPGVLVTMEYTSAITPPTIYANYYPYAINSPYPNYFINQYGDVYENSWSPTTSFLLYSELYNVAPGYGSLGYTVYFDPLLQTLESVF